MQHAESNFQIAAVRLLRTYGFFCFSIPNGTRLSRSQARIAKAEGLLAGVSDVIILLRQKPVFVEFKTPAGRWTQQETQKTFEREVKARGYDYQIWDSWPQVETFINEHRGK